MSSQETQTLQVHKMLISKWYYGHQGYHQDQSIGIMAIKATMIDNFQYSCIITTKTTTKIDNSYLRYHCHQGNPNLLSHLEP